MQTLQHTPSEFPAPRTVETNHCRRKNHLVAKTGRPLRPALVA